jgi:hypothetical protein
VSARLIPINTCNTYYIHVAPVTGKKDVYELNNIIHSNIQSEAVTYKSVDTVAEADEAVN